MNKIYIAFMLFFLSSASAFCQQDEKKEDEKTIWDRLVWNEKMLNIKLDTRVDARAVFKNGEEDELGFYGQTFKLWLVGEIVPGVRYRVRHRFNKVQMPLRDGYSSATDQAWIAFDAGSKWTFTVGKQSVQFGTFEYDYNPADVYIPTMCFDDLDAYKTGVNVAYKFLGQTMNLQVVNSDAPQYASEEYKKKALALNLLWEGDLLDGAIRTRWAYGAFQHDKDKFYNWLTAGTQFNIEKFTTEVDYYLGNKNADYGSMVNNDDLGYRYVKDQSVSVNLKYNFGKWRPFVKGIWNQRVDKAFDQTAYQQTGIQTAMEYYPFDGLLKDLRFHAMYAFESTHFKGEYDNLKNVDSHTILAGMRWLFKVK